MVSGNADASLDQIYFQLFSSHLIIVKKKNVCREKSIGIIILILFSFFVIMHGINYWDEYGKIF